MGHVSHTHRDLRPLITIFSMKISQFSIWGVPSIPINSVTPRRIGEE